MKNTVLNVIGLPKFRLPLEEADALKKVIDHSYMLGNPLVYYLPVSIIANIIVMNIQLS